MKRRALRLAAISTVLVAFAPVAAACPTCSVGQGLETLAYVLGFLAIPYLVVAGVVYWMRKVTSQERLTP